MLESLDSPYIHEANHENFQSLVIENSNIGPVLINFWSKKAGPCLRQYPVLDKVIHHYEGRLLLINIDTQKEFKVTKEYGITSVPTLKLIRNGKVVETMHGYQSEEELLSIFDLYVARDSDKTLVEVIDQYTKGEKEPAYEKLASAIVNDSINPRLPLAMCKLLRHEGRISEALKLIASLPANVRKYKEFDTLQAELYFYNKLDPNVDVELLIQDEADANELALILQFICYMAVQKQYESALKYVVKMMDIDVHYGDDFAKEAMLNIFKLLEEDNSLVSTYRPYLNRYTH